MAVNPAADLLSNYQGAFAITPDDNNNLEFQTRGIYVGTGGNLTVTTIQGDEITFVSVPSGMMMPLCVRRVHATGTAATDLVGLT